MELSAELFSDIVGRCATDVSRPADDRRKHARFPLGARATISSIRRGLEGMESPVVVRDISLAGIGLLSPDAMEVGEEFTVQFSGEHGTPARILCVVNHCESGGYGGSQFVIGATFVLVIFPSEALAEFSDDADKRLRRAGIPCLTHSESKEPPATPGSLLITLIGSVHAAIDWLGKFSLRWTSSLGEDVTRTA